MVRSKCREISVAVRSTAVERTITGSIFSLLSLGSETSLSLPMESPREPRLRGPLCDRREPLLLLL